MYANSAQLIENSNSTRQNIDLHREKFEKNRQNINWKSCLQGQQVSN